MSICKGGQRRNHGLKVGSQRLVVQSLFVALLTDIQAEPTTVIQREKSERLPEEQLPNKIFQVLFIQLATIAMERKFARPLSSRYCEQCIDLTMRQLKRYGSIRCHY